MPDDDVANLVTVTKTNIIRWHSLWLSENCCHQNTAQCLVPWCAAVLAAVDVSPIAAQRSQLLSKSPTDLRRGHRSCKIWLSYESNLIASWMHRHNSRYFQQHLRIVMQSLRAQSLAPGESGCVYKYSNALVRMPGVSGSIMCCF
jgi:hypothetical protein